MIVIDDLYKRYRTEHGPGKWVLSGINLTISDRVNVGLIGKNGAGKSTLLRLIGEIDVPTRGTVTRNCRTSWPLGLAGGLQGSLTGRQNSKFVCRLLGMEEDIEDRVNFIKDFSEIGDAFEEPVKTYSSGMGARLRFALSMAFDFDVYLVDELTSVGDESFRNKSLNAFKSIANRAGLIMVSHSEATLKDYCSAGVFLNNGKAFWFDSIDDAFRAYTESIR